jgi:hypothetical protein
LIDPPSCMNTIRHTDEKDAQNLTPHLGRLKKGSRIF